MATVPGAYLYMPYLSPEGQWPPRGKGSWVSGDLLAGRAAEWVSP